MLKVECDDNGCFVGLKDEDGNIWTADDIHGQLSYLSNKIEELLEQLRSRTHALPEFVSQAYDEVDELRKERDAYKKARDEWYERDIEDLRRASELDTLCRLALALTDTGSFEFLENFSPVYGNEIPPGWAVVEEIRQVLLRGY